MIVLPIGVFAIVLAVLVALSLLGKLGTWNAHRGEPKAGRPTDHRKDSDFWGAS